MIRQYLSNINESDTMSILQKKQIELKKASAHKYNGQWYENVKESAMPFEHVVEKQINEEIKKHDESVDSKHQGNFLHMVKPLASYDDEV